MRILASLVIALSVLPAAAETQPSVIGLWRVADGTATIRIVRCGDAVCGYVASAPPPGPNTDTAVGQKILIDLRPDGESWRGVIYNLDDGQNYKGEISANGGLLKVKGCLPGGVCGGETWRREPEAPSRGKKARSAQPR